jgi:hypothetical protein
MTKEIHDLADLSPDASNPNKGTARGRYMIEQSLRDAGAGRSIVIDREGRVIAGNKTLEAWAEMGGEIEVIRTDGKKLVVVQREDLDLDDPEGPARRLSYFDNRVSEVSLEWDAEVVFGHEGLGLDLSGMFHEDELDRLLADLERSDQEPYTPNYAPEMGDAAVTPAQVEAMATRLDGRFDAQPIDQIEILCPHCGESLFVNRKDLAAKGGAT